MEVHVDSELMLNVFGVHNMHEELVASLHTVFHVLCFMPGKLPLDVDNPLAS